MPSPSPLAWTLLKNLEEILWGHVRIDVIREPVIQSILILIKGVFPTCLSIYDVTDRLNHLVNHTHEGCSHVRDLGELQSKSATQPYSVVSTSVFFDKNFVKE